MDRGPMRQDAQWAAEHFRRWMMAKRRNLVLLAVGSVPVLLLLMGIFRVGFGGESVGEAVLNGLFGAIALPAIVGLTAWWLSPAKALTKVGRLRPVRLLEADTPDQVRVVGDAGVAVQWRVGRRQGAAMPPPGVRVWATEPVSRGCCIALVLEEPRRGGRHVIEPRGPSWRPTQGATRAAHGTR